MRSLAHLPLIPVPGGWRWQEVFAAAVALIATNMAAKIPETTAPFRGWARKSLVAISLMREQRFARGKVSLVGIDSGRL
jgi:hypothetical protein